MNNPKWNISHAVYSQLDQLVDKLFREVLGDIINTGCVLIHVNKEAPSKLVDQVIVVGSGVSRKLDSLVNHRGQHAEMLRVEILCILVGLLMDQSDCTKTRISRLNISTRR